MKALLRGVSRVLAISMAVQLISAAAPAAQPSVRAASSNLAYNGGFETVKTGQADWVNGAGADGWGVWKATAGGLVSVTDAVYRSGGSSVEVKHPATARTGLSQDVTVDQVPAGGRTFKLGAWIKTEDVAASQGVFIRTQYWEKLTSKDGSNVKIGDGPSLSKLTGTNDWTYREMILNAPQSTRYIRLEPFFETGTGTAWFDDITLQEWDGMTSLALEPATVKLRKDDSFTLVPRVLPADSSGYELTWSSLNPGVATVDQQGTVTAHDIGTAVIRAATTDGLFAAQSTVMIESSEMLDGYASLRAKWRDLLLGGQEIQVGDPDIQLAIELLNAKVSNAEQTGSWDLLSKEADPTALFAGVITKTNTKSANISSAYGRIVDMAAAYSNPHSAYYGNAELLSDALKALEWMHQYQYHPGKSISDNWWDWEIGAPQALANVLVLLYDELPEAKRSQYLQTIDRFVPDPRKRVQNASVVETGANLLDKALVVTLSGVLGDNSARVDLARGSISGEFQYTSSGDGIYRDGSLIQHSNNAYTGGYGSVLLGRVSDLLYLYSGSPWEITDPNVENVYRWVENVFEPLIYKGAIMDSVRGRSISRSRDSDHLTGRGIIRTIGRLTQGAPEPYAASMKSKIKEWIAADTSFESYYRGLSLYDINVLKSIATDPAVTPRGPLVKHQQFSAMDRVAHLREGFGFGISMFSDRISAFEFGNGENAKGWYTGIGMTSLYTDDLKQFSNQYWPTVNSFRLPGTTTDGYAKAPAAWGSFYNGSDWVGGSSIDGLYGSAGLDMSLSKSTGSNLKAKKSWFMFDDEIVALGSGIASPDQRNVETIVENRQINDAGDNVLLVNGEAQPSQLGWQATLSDVRWAHLAGNVPGERIGYYFPHSPAISALREARTGSWKAINSGESADEVTRNYLSLAFGHGTAPDNGDYAYVLLPNQDASATESYSSNPDIEILSQTNQAHAVKEKKLGVSSYNFWEGAAAAGVRTDRPASVQVREQGTELTVAVSDPTWKANKVVVDLAKVAGETIAADSRVRVLQTMPYLRLEIDTQGGMGQTYAIKLRFDPNRTVEFEQPIVVSVAEDAYVNAGDSASTNFGSVGYLNIKNGTGNYLREVLLKFDLNELDASAEIDSAKLFVYSRINDSRTGTAEIGAFRIADDWSEGAVTWNTKPAAGALADKILFSNQLQWRSFDVTDEARSLTEPNRVFSVTLKELTTDLSADIRSKENENGIYKSYLEITLKPDVPALADLVVSAPESLLAGASASIRTEALYSNDSRLLVTAGVQYESSDETVASVDPDGTLRAHRGGNATITVRYQGQAKSFELQVVEPEAELIGIRLEGPAELEEGTTGQAVASALFDNDDEVVLTEGVQYASSDETVATVDADGTVRAHVAGTTVISAAYAGKSASFTLTVKQSAEGSGEGNGEGNGNGNGNGSGGGNGNGSGSEGSTNPSPVTPPVPPITPEPSPERVEITGERLQQEAAVNGQVKLSFDKPVSELILPGNAAEWLADNALAIEANGIGIGVPASLLKSWQKLAEDDSAQGGSIVLRTNAVQEGELDALLAAERKRTGASIRTAGGAVGFTLSLTRPSGASADLSEFEEPLSLLLPAVIDGSLVGIYRLEADGKLKYVGGVNGDGKLAADVREPGRYAVLAYEKQFADLPDSHWASGQVKQLAARQLITGVSLDSFEPARSITRSEFTTLLVRLLDLQEAATVDFADVNPNAWYAHDVALAVRAGIVQGAGATKFAPNASITRQEMAAMIVRAYEYKTGVIAADNESTEFADIDAAPGWAQAAIRKANALGVGEGRSKTKFSPLENGTRAESAALIFRLMQKLDGSNG
ncbi:Ig-like protein group 2 [Cohnella sp. SGD-V74]|nr:Ig-like protein group 2 [Cohnella sp. SGD-V74]